MRSAVQPMFLLATLVLWSGFAVAELAVIYDSGATKLVTVHEPIR